VNTRLAKLLVTALLLVAVAAAVTAARNEDHSRLSEAYLEGAKQPCAAFADAVAPLRVDAGFENLLRQAEGFREARTELGDELTALATNDDDRQRVEPLLESLVAGNEILRDAEGLVSDDDPRAAYRRLDDWTRELSVQARLTDRLGLGDCG
jgi:hypothetical protein